MLDPNSGAPKSGQRLLTGVSSSHSPRQRRLMLAALVLLLVSLAVVLYRDSDFWFPDTQEADAELLSPSGTSDGSPAAAAPASSPAVATSRKKAGVRGAAPSNSQVSNDFSDPGPVITATRTVLPPLEVEVVAGDSSRIMRPGSNAVRVDLQHPPTRQRPAPSVSSTAETAAKVTTPAAQRASISADTAENVVTRSIQPDYPRLARQMRVQGSVVLQALIGRDGLIEDLRVVSGPTILAEAAEEAVRQWHFKPHYIGAQPVETKANITVNFTISTN